MTIELEFWVCVVVCRRAKSHWLDEKTQLPITQEESRKYVASIKAGEYMYLAGCILAPICDEQTQDAADRKARELASKSGRDHMVVLNADLVRSPARENA